MSARQRRSRRRATSSDPTPSSTPSTPPPIKRQSGEQTTSFSTPSREHSSSRQKTSETESIQIIGDIQVSLLSSTTSKDGEIWHKGSFSFLLSNKRYRVSSTKEDWMGLQYTGVMEKARKLIVDTAESSGLDMSRVLLEPAMASCLPWKLAWVTLENIILEHFHTMGSDLRRLALSFDNF